MKTIAKAIFPAVFSLLTLNAFAATTLPSFFTDNMVIQQNAYVPFWGTSAKSKTVKITGSWDSNTYTAQSDKNGSWKVELKTPSYGGPYTITIDDGTVLTLKNVLIGDVWLCSGQSNMEMPLAGWGKVNNYEEEIANANYPEIRLLQAQQVYSAKPVDELKVQHGGWQVCSPKTIADFSSTAYFFARKLYKETRVPVGLLHSSWGGTVIEAWASAGALKTSHDFDAALADLDKDQDEVAKKYNGEMKKWNTKLEAVDKGFRDGEPVYAGDGFDYSRWKTVALPGLWENADLQNFDGVVWYRRQVDLPKELMGSTLTLTFYADDDDTVWLNGKMIGATRGYNVKREYKISPEMLKDSNILTIRVFDSGGGGGIYGDENEFTLSANSITIPLAGKWKYSVGTGLSGLPSMPAVPQGPNRPSVLYNAMIHPILQYRLKGAIWYQGESNAERAFQYRALFPLMIKDWRVKFNNPDMPFYFVQLANYKAKRSEPAPSSWAELREAQLMALQLPNTGMASAIDIGDADDIHPKNKQEVGERLARIALANLYNKDIEYSGPLYKSYKVKGSEVILTFDHDKGLQAKGGALKGFEIAGADKKFYWADAKIEDNTVIISSPKVAKPAAVRYNWADNPDGNLTNASGLPASPFRTDNWPGITFGKI